MGGRGWERVGVEGRTRAGVDDHEAELEERAEPLDRGVHAQRRARGEARGALGRVAQRLHEGARGGEADAAEVLLEEAVHRHRLLHLPLRLLDEQLRLLGDAQGDVLLRRRARAPARPLQRRLSRQDLHPERPAPPGGDEAVLLAAEAPEVERRERVVRLVDAHQVLLVVDAHLPRREQARGRCQAAAFKAIARAALSRCPGARTVAVNKKTEQP